MPIDPALIDHTLLAPGATASDIDSLLADAHAYPFASVCVNPTWVARCVRSLKHTPVDVCTVVGFPLGATTTATKAAEAREAVSTGAGEIDMVVNIGELKSGNLDAVTEDISQVRLAAARPTVLKVILETCLLTSDEIVAGCRAAQEAGADFVKTSTGFSTGGATTEAVCLMRETVGPTMGVKASGGIRTIEDAEAMLEAGANRIGASSSLRLIGAE